MDRRAFLAASSVAAAAGSLGVNAQAPVMDATTADSAATASALFSRVDFAHDGLALSPAEYAAVLGEAATTCTLQPDFYSLGGFVEAIEQDFATRLGKETAIFLPTGTLANHLAVRRLAGTDRRVLVQADSHLFNDSGDCAQTLSGLNLIPIAGDGGAIRLEDIERWVAQSASGRVETRVGVISIESPVRRAGHQYVDPVELRRISAFARERGIRLHLDGARMFNLPLHTGQEIRSIAALFDTVYVSLWKHFNAATGAILAGSREHLEDLFHERRRFGGALPAAWPSLAPVPRFVETYETDYAGAWQIADSLIEGLGADRRFRFAKLPRGTSRITMTLAGVDPQTFSTRLEESGVHALPNDPADGNVFHLQVNASLLRRSADELILAFLRTAG